jgi:hypothetical protein
MYFGLVSCIYGESILLKRKRKMIIYSDYFTDLEGDGTGITEGKIAAFSCSNGGKKLECKSGEIRE